VELTAEWASAGVAMLVAAGGAGAWMHKLYEDARRATPLFRPAMAGGRLIGFEIVNRLDEDLMIGEAIADGPLGLPVFGDDGYTSAAQVGVDMGGNRRSLDWTVPANGTRYFSIFAETEVSKVSLTVSSSLYTLRRKRFSVAIRAKL
jgi:hypothetical protein